MLYLSLMTKSVESYSSSKLNGFRSSLSYHNSWPVSSAVISQTKSAIVCGNMGFILIEPVVQISTLVTFIWFKWRTHSGNTNSLCCFSLSRKWSSSACVTLCSFQVTYVGSQLLTIILFIVPCFKIFFSNPLIPPTRPSSLWFLSLRDSQQSVIRNTYEFSALSIAKFRIRISSG